MRTHSFPNPAIWLFLGTSLIQGIVAGSPNIVLIVSDDHGTDALGCYGNPVIQTPALDALAADGTRFTEAHCTTASCSPSRSVILTGLHNHRNGMYGLEHSYHHFQSFDTHPLPNRFGNREEGYPGIHPVIYDPQTVVVPPFLPDTEVNRAEIAEYYQSVSRMDEGIGRLITLLKESDQYDRSLIRYISDNGVAFAGAKTTLYDPGIKLPCIVREPGQTKTGRTQDAMVSWVDLAPTILDYAGISVSGMELHGRSFRRGVSGDLKGWDKIYASHTFHQVTMYYPMRALKNRRYELIYNLVSELEFPLARDLLQSPTWISVQKEGLALYGKRSPEALLRHDRVELYDLRSDPHETINLSEDPAHEAVQLEMMSQLREYLYETKDPWAF